MCGIAGILGKDICKNDLIQILEPITHRGEESHRFEMFISPEISFGTHRLAIVDEAHGHQPFQSDDKQVTVIFNGQIYNHDKLRKDLSAEFEFNSKCDTEVILKAYLKWGKDFVDYLDGIFGIALYDDYQKELILARDPMGVKPLYFAYDKDRVYFSSEIKSLSKIVNSEIIELPPGFLWVNSKVQKYFTLGNFNSKHDFNARNNDHELALKEHLTKAIEKRIKKEDSKIACLLSGGVDSSIVTYLAKQTHPNIIAYTLAEPGKNSGDLESAKKVANFLGIEHIIVSPSVDEMSDFYLKHGVYMTESFEPVLVRNAVAYHFVCRQVVADGFKYCLNGEGADELFGGYDFVSEVSKRQQDEIIRHSLSIIHNTYLKMADRASMFATLEARVPYMDKAFVKLALSLPSEARIQDSMNKVALRNAFQNDLPEEIIYRKKVGMNEGAGFGVNRPDQSIYFTAVKNYYEKKQHQFEKDLALCSKGNKLGHIDLNQVEEVYNFARFIEFNFHKLKDSTARLQLNTALREHNLKLSG